MINKINALLKNPFSSEQDLLDFYKACLAKRVGTYRLDEVGPIMSVGSKEEVEGYVNRRFYFNGIGLDMPDKIDWYATPNGDLEWNGGFVRQGYFMYLADAYKDTQDERYAKAIIDQMLDYIRNVPPFDPTDKPYLEYKKSTWRPFEAAGRAAENWPVALAKIINSTSMTPEAFAEIYYSIYEHAKFLSIHHWRTGNHACLEVAGLGVMSILYQEFAQADEWRSYSVEFLMHMLDDEFHDDGYTMEMSGAYHWVAMRNFFAFYQVASQNGMADIFPQKYIDIIQKAAWAEFYQQKPDYSLPVTNDSNITTNHKMQLSQLGGLLGDDILKYRLSGGTCGKAPAETSHFFPSAQVAIFRSDWSADAVFASFDMGPWGTNHMNEDQLNFELSAFGRNLLVNCGRWRYTTSPDVSWLDRAQYFKTTASYNSLLVDEMSQMSADAHGTMVCSDSYDYACGTFEGGYGESVKNTDETTLRTKGLTSEKICRIKDSAHVREVYFAKPEFFIVRDSVHFTGEHSAQQIWHMAQGNVKQVGNTVYSDFDDANFIMVQLNCPDFKLFRGSEVPFRGWNCPKYDHLVPAPELSFEAKGTGSVVFETLILPVKGKVDPEQLPCFKRTIVDGVSSYEIMWQGTTVIVPCDFKGKPTRCFSV